MAFKLLDSGSGVDEFAKAIPSAIQGYYDAEARNQRRMELAAKLAAHDESEKYKEYEARMKAHEAGFDTKGISKEDMLSMNMPRRTDANAITDPYKRMQMIKIKADLEDKGFSSQAADAAIQEAFGISPQQESVDGQYLVADNTGGIAPPSEGGLVKPGLVGASQGFVNLTPEGQRKKQMAMRKAQLENQLMEQKLRSGQAEVLEGQEKKEKSQEMKEIKSNLMGNEIRDTIKAVESGDSTLPVVGFGAESAAAFPGTDARTVKGRIETIKANFGFDKLQAMRNASKTGGALGQVSDSERSALEATIGKIDQSLNKKDFVRNLKRAHNTYMDMVHGIGNGPKRYEGVGSDAPPQDGGAPKDGATKVWNGTTYKLVGDEWVAQ